MQDFVYVVMTNAAEGRDAEFNDWYSHRHLHDVVQVPGFMAARRFVLNDIQRRELPPGQPRYLSLYDICTEDLRQTLGLLAARAGTPAMPTSEALVRHSAVVYRPLGPPVRKP